MKLIWTGSSLPGWQHAVGTQAAFGYTGFFFKAKPMLTPIIRAGLVCAALKAVLVNEHSGL